MGSLWHHDEITQMMPARCFSKETIDRMVFVAALIHGEERAKAALFAEFEGRASKLIPVE